MVNKRLLLLVEKLSCHSRKFICIYRLQNHFLWLQIEQELHVGGESQQVAITPNVIVSKLDEVLNAIFLWVFPDGRETFCLGTFCFHLNWNTLAFIADKEIQLQAGIFLEIV